MTVSNLSAVGAFVSLVLASGQTSSSRLRVDDTVGNLLAHPAFAGFGRLLLPWDDRRVDTSMRLSAIGSLLPYHSHVDPALVVSSLNRMIDDAAAGRTIFYDFYGAEEKEADPSRRSVPTARHDSVVRRCRDLPRSCSCTPAIPTLLGRNRQPSLPLVRLTESHYLR